MRTRSEGPAASGASAATRGGGARYRAAYLAGFVALLALSELIYRHLHKHGLSVGGDEPYYILQAQAYRHLSPHILATLTQDLQRNTLSFAFSPGTTLPQVGHWVGPHGVVSDFEPGLGVLLVPFVAVLGAYEGGVGGILFYNILLMMYLHQRASRLWRLDRSAQVVLAVAMAFPAVFVAVTQIYPDLIAGLLFAAGALEIVAIERRGRSSRWSRAVICGVAAILPWLQPKNLVGTVLLVLTLVVLLGREASRRATLIGIAGVAVSVTLFFAYNEYYFATLIGLPEKFPTVSQKGVEYSLGLIFDRHQGLLPQAPFLVLAGVGMKRCWRTCPLAVSVTTVMFAAIWLLNGTLVGNPYGGTSPAGRFQWTLLALLLPWLAAVLADASRTSRTRWLAAGLAVLGGLQAVPFVRDSHHYYNSMILKDPVWPGWWPPLNPILPEFGAKGHTLGVPSYGLALEIAILAVVILVLNRWLPPPAAPTSNWTGNSGYQAGV